MAAVYILVQSKNPIFKIGRSESPYRRYKQLSKDWGSFDLEKSFVINCKAKEASKLENMLHTLFSDYKVNFGISSTTGDTEFFNMKCYEDLKEFINNTLLKMKQNLFIKEFQEIYDIGKAWDMHKQLLRSI